jgi:hypothetical protein
LYQRVGAKIHHRFARLTVSGFSRCGRETPGIPSLTNDFSTVYDAATASKLSTVFSMPSFQLDSRLPMSRTGRGIPPLKVFCHRKKFPRYSGSAQSSDALLPLEGGMQQTIYSLETPNAPWVECGGNDDVNCLVPHSREKRASI